MKQLTRGPPANDPEGTPIVRWPPEVAISGWELADLDGSGFVSDLEGDFLRGLVDFGYLVECLVEVDTTLTDASLVGEIAAAAYMDVVSHVI